jgi:uncharacterized membrane protein
MNWNPQAGQDPTGAPYSTTQDAQQNKVMAMLAYIVFFVPLLTGDSNRSPFVKFHTNQGAILFIAAVVFSIALGIVTSVLGLLVGILSFVNPLLFTPLRFLISMLNILGLIPLGFVILGAINASNGEMKQLPYIGHFTIIK